MLSQFVYANVQCTKPSFISFHEMSIHFLPCRQIHGNLGSYVAEGLEVIEPEEWHHLVYRYDAQSEC